MFGYIKPRIPELRVKEHELYKAIYCGLCKTERKQTGLFSCFALSYDFVFLYLLRSELLKNPTSFRQRKNRIFHRANRNVASENGQLSYCAGVSALLNYYKLKDNARDEGFFGRLSAKLLLPYARHSLKKARKITDLPEKELETAFARFSEMEKQGESPDTLAKESGYLLALCASHGTEDELTALALNRIGQAVGTWLYLADAADDWQEDLQKKRFTPFGKNGPDRTVLKYTLDAHANDADRMLSMVPVYDPAYRALLKNILYDGMNDEAERILDENTRRNAKKNAGKDAHKKKGK